MVSSFKKEAPTRLPRRLLLRLPPAPVRLWHSTSKPRMPPTQSPSSTTCRQQKNHPSGSQAPARIQGKAFPKPPCPSHLATEAGALSRVQEGGIGLVGTGDDVAHSMLVAP